MAPDAGDGRCLHAGTVSQRHEPIELVSVAVLGIARSTGPRLATHHAGATGLTPSVARRAYFGAGSESETAVLGRRDLGPAARPGPFIIEEYDATTIVPPGATAQPDTMGNIVIELPSPTRAVDARS